MENEAELVLAQNPGQDDSARRPEGHVEARWLDRRRGQGEPLRLRVAAPSSRLADRKGCKGCALGGGTLEPCDFGPRRTTLGVARRTAVMFHAVRSASDRAIKRRPRPNVSNAVCCSRPISGAVHRQ